MCKAMTVRQVIRVQEAMDNTSTLILIIMCNAVLAAVLYWLVFLL